jgi:predicted RNA-binding protein (virulence factor B family)
MKSNSCVVSLRKPQVPRLVRATACNRSVVEAIFTKYSQSVEKYKLGPKLIYNVDESGLSAVHNSPKVVAVKESKQVGSVTSGERRGVTVTITGCSNALGSSVPPVLIFPWVYLKD